MGQGVCWKTRDGAHCLFSAALAALKSLKYCVIAFAASLCSLIVGPLFAGLQVMAVYLLQAIKARTDRKNVYACCYFSEISMAPRLTSHGLRAASRLAICALAKAVQTATQQLHPMQLDIRLHAVQAQRQQTDPGPILRSKFKSLTLMKHWMKTAGLCPLVQPL